MSDTDAMIHRELFEKINSNTLQVERLATKVEVLTEQNDKLFKILKLAMMMTSFIMFALLFAVIYGAIGNEGMKAVRGAMPVISAQMDGADELTGFFSKAKEIYFT